MITCCVTVSRPLRNRFETRAADRIRIGRTGSAPKTLSRRCVIPAKSADRFAVMSDTLYAYNDRQVLLISSEQLNAEVLRACRAGDFNFLGFMAGYDPDRLGRAEDSRGAVGSHYAARTGQLSVLRSGHKIKVTARSLPHHPLRPAMFSRDILNFRVRVSPNMVVLIILLLLLSLVIVSCRFLKIHGIRNLNKKSCVGYTALHEASINGHLACVEWLTRYSGCKPTEVDKEGCNALHLASK